MIFEHNMNFILSLSVFYLILSDVSSSLVPRETLAASQIIKKKKDLEDCCELAKNCAKGKESLSLHSFKHEREVSPKIKLVKTVIPFDPEKHTLAILV